MSPHKIRSMQKTHQSGDIRKKPEQPNACEGFFTDTNCPARTFRHTQYRKDTPAANENSGSFITMESLILPSRTVCAEREYCFRGYTYDASVLAFTTGDISTAALRRRISDSSATGDTAADQQGCRSFFCYHKQKIKVRGERRGCAPLPVLTSAEKTDCGRRPVRDAPTDRK